MSKQGFLITNKALGIFLLQFVIVLTLHSQTKKQPLVILKHRVQYNALLTATYSKYTNWKYQYSNFATNLKLLLHYDSVNKTGLGIHTRFYGELGYTKIIDSVWYTNTDIWEIQHNWNLTETSKKWTTSYSIYVTSQFLNRYTRKSIEGLSNSSPEVRQQKVWQSGIFNPMIFEFSYGKCYNFWKMCKIYFSFAQIRLTSDPLIGAAKNNIDKEKLLIIDNSALVKCDYGFGIQTIIRKKINDHFRWENFSRIFGNSIHPSKVTFDIKNSFIVNPINHLTISFNTRLYYRPIKLPYLVQQKYEIVCGIEF